MKALRQRIWAWALAGAWISIGLGACSRDESTPAPAPAQTPITAAAGKAPSALVAVAGLPPRRAIAGLAGLQIASRVAFVTAPTKPHTLSVTYLFPERVRLRMALEPAQSAERVLAYRCGSRGFFIGPRESASRELLGGELDALALQMELRRALFLWPDGFAWLGDGEQRRVELGALGSLRVDLDAAGRPGAMHSFDAHSAHVETLREVVWKPGGARLFPSRFELWAGSEKIWVEEVEKVETALNYIDAFFLPPDRRGLADTGREAPRSIDASGEFECRIGLPTAPPPTWASAFAAAEEARAAWAGRGVAALDGDWLELDARAAPAAVVLRAATIEAVHAAEWTWREECPAWELDLDSVSRVDVAKLALLVRGVPSDPVPRVRLERLCGADKAETFRLIALPGVR